MDLAERNRLITATQGFAALSVSLLSAPISLALAMASVITVAWHGSDSAQEVAGVLFLCAIAASGIAVWYYRRRFGVVRTKHGALTVCLLILACPGAFALLYRADAVDYTSTNPLSFNCLFWAILYLVFYLFPYRLRSHSIWFSVLFLALCFLTYDGELSKRLFLGGDLMGNAHAGNIFIWFAFAVHGLLDHLLLLRLLPRTSLSSSMEAPSAQQHG